jgi:hypothetical protein
MTDVRHIPVLERDAAGRFTPHVRTRREHILDRAVRNQTGYAVRRQMVEDAGEPSWFQWHTICVEFARLWAAQ